MIGKTLQIWNHGLNKWIDICVIENEDDEFHCKWVLEKFGDEARVVDNHRGV